MDSTPIHANPRHCRAGGLSRPRYSPAGLVAWPFLHHDVEYRPLAHLNLSECSKTFDLHYDGFEAVPIARAVDVDIHSAAPKVNLAPAHSRPKRGSQTRRLGAILTAYRSIYRR
jgi:hypothetical protein